MTAVIVTILVCGATLAGWGLWLYAGRCDHVWEDRGNKIELVDGRTRVGTRIHQRCRECGAWRKVDL